MRRSSVRVCAVQNETFKLTEWEKRAIMGRGEVLTLSGGLPLSPLRTPGEGVACADMKAGCICIYLHGPPWYECGGKGSDR